MRLENYRNPDLVHKLEGRIAQVAEKVCGTAGQLTLMEVCGTHTMAIGRHGLRSLLPHSIRMLSGPGCPVCVTSARDIDRAIEIGAKPGVVVTTFGDLFRVPGSRGSLEEAKAAGADVRVVVSPFEALVLAEKHRDRDVVFLGVGFETTSPTIAATIKYAAKKDAGNFSVLPMMKVIPPALRAILSREGAKLDGFLLPGHVSAVIGVQPYTFIPEEFGVPCVIAGFEPVDILQGILMLLEQMDAGRPVVEIGYRRVVTESGNPHAQALTSEVFALRDAEWRAIGTIEQSGLGMSREYRKFDAGERFPVEVPEPEPPRGCICGEILFGLKQPGECALFGNACTPERPVGPCMVSAEGTCAAHYKYGES